MATVNSMNLGADQNYIDLNIGSNNTMIGYNCGASYVNAESYNIIIGSQVSCQPNESNSIRLGAGTGTGVNEIATTYISGVYGASDSLTDQGIMVVGDNDQQVGLPATTSFTPVLEFGGASTGITYSTQAGYYQYIGGVSNGVVFVSVCLILTSKGSSTGTATLTVPTPTAKIDCILPLYGDKFLAPLNGPKAKIGSGTSVVSFSDFKVGLETVLSDDSFNDDTQIIFSGTYLLT